MANNDAYIIRLNPSRWTTPALKPSQLVTLHLQVYRFDSANSVYDHVSLRDFFLRLLINQYRKSPHNCFLPYIFDGYPQDPLPNTTSLKAMRDPILSSLSPNCRMVFRYDPIKDLGCLVHIGYDFPLIDQPPYTILWQTAMHQRQDQLREILLDT